MRTEVVIRLGLAFGMLLAASILFVACTQTAPNPSASVPTQATVNTQTSDQTQAPAPTQISAAQKPAALTTTDYPTKPVTLMVAQSAGGSTDAGARILASIAEKELGQPITVLNKAGAGGQIGWAELSLQKPDGYYLGVANLPALNTIILNPERKATFGIEAFTPIVNQVLDQGIIVVKPDSPYKSLKDIAADAKKRPGAIKIGYTGLLSHGHFGVLLFQESAGIKLQGVEMEGSPAIATAVMGGHIDVGVDRVGSWAQMVKSGQLRALAILDKEKSTFLPDVTTSVEQGFPDLMTASAAGIMAPKGVPELILKKIETVFLTAMKNPEHLDKMEKGGQRVKIMARDEYTKYVMEWHEKTKQLLQLAGNS